MAGKITKFQTYFLRAVDGEEWELWSLSGGKRPQFVRRLSNPADVPGETVVSLPTERTITYPAWLATNDRAVIPEILQLQLEQRGLLNKNTGANVMDFRVIESRENHSLAVATVLQPDFPPELTFEHGIRFEPSVFTLPLPQDRLTIWRERGRLAVAATRGRDPVLAQVLSDRELSAAAALELKCIVYQLQAQNLCEQFLGVTVWGGFSAEEIERLQKHFDLKVTHEAVPPPHLPSRRSKLLPPEVAVLHAKRNRRQQIARVITVFLVLYILGVLAIIGHIEWLQFKADRLRRRLQSQIPTVAAIQNTADRWRKVEWAVNPKLYPVELLYQIASLLPPDGLRLTAFEMEKGKLSIRGEASTAPAAFKFAEDIKTNSELQPFNWSMPSPTLRPDGRAEFVIQGEPKIAKTD